MLDDDKCIWFDVLLTIWLFEWCVGDSCILTQQPQFSDGLFAFCNLLDIFDLILLIAAAACDKEVADEDGWDIVEFSKLAGDDDIVASRNS